MYLLENFSRGVLLEIKCESGKKENSLPNTEKEQFKSPAWSAVIAVSQLTTDLITVVLKQPTVFSLSSRGYNRHMPPCPANFLFYFILDRVLFCCPGWSAVPQSPLTITSPSQV